MPIRDRTTDAVREEQPRRAMPQHGKCRLELMRHEADGRAGRRRQRAERAHVQQGAIEVVHPTPRPYDERPRLTLDRHWPIERR